MTNVPTMTRNEFIPKFMEQRYYLYGESNPQELFDRVAQHGSNKKHQEYYQQFLDVLNAYDFLPSRMSHMNSDRPFASSCFVFGMEDDWESIFKCLHDAVAVQRFSGGTGFNFSALRPAGDAIKSTQGQASGPVAFMELFHQTMLVMKRAQRKMAAMMAILNVNHPDIEEFIDCKINEGSLWTFNVSVGITDDFMLAVKNDEEWHLTWNGEIRKTISARELWNKIVVNSWKNAEPGVVFLDTVLKTDRMGLSRDTLACNPCSEQWLPPYASCNLGSINLSNHVTDNGIILWDKLENTTRIGIRFLDGSLSNAWFPLQECRDASDKYRNIGLSVMGFHDMLIMRDTPYASKEACELGEKIMEFINSVAHEESKAIGYEEFGEATRVNTTLTTIQPTGSLSTMAGVASAIEPIYSPIENRFSYVASFSEPYRVVTRKIRHEGWPKQEIIAWAEEHGTLLNCPHIPEKYRSIFASTNEIPWKAHIDMQAAFQKHLCQGTSKTTNLDNSATIQDVSNIFMYAWETGCLGMTVYRQGSRDVEILSTTKKDDSYFCPTCLDNGERIMLIKNGGCKSCLKCDYSLCEL